MIARWFDRLLAPIDGAWLAAFRVCFGALIAVSMARFLGNGWVDELLLRPSFHFKYWGFEWVTPLSPTAMHALVAGLAGLGVCVSLGLAFRLTAPALALGFTYVQLLDVSTYLNHYYLAVLLSWLLAVSPAGRVVSIDRWLSDRWAHRAAASAQASAEASERVNGVAAAWHVLFRIQVGVVYVFAGLAKAQSDWLLHAQPLRIWLGQSTKLPLLGSLFTLEPVPLLLSWLGFLFDTTIVAWLLWRRTRPWAYLVVIAFHTLTQLLFNIGMFPAIMITSALVFFSPSWPRRLLAWLASIRSGNRVPPPTPAPTPPTPPRASVRRRLWLAVGAAYCGLQLILPLRHWLYGGNVLWHEQGMRYSWRVMVRVKGGGTTFRVREPSGSEWRVSPRDYLTARQEAEMSSQPDLILQLAHHIARDFDARGRGPVQVRADARVTLNGRRSVPLIDPDVDLASVSDGLALSSWVLPAPAAAPPHTRPIL